MEFDFYKTKKNKSTNVLKSKLFDEISDAFFVFTISVHDDYKMPFISDSAYDMFEILPDDMFTNTILSVHSRIHQEDKNLVKQSLIDAIKKGKKWDVIFRAQLPDKGLCWLKVTTKREVNNDGSVELYGRITDITDLKDQELKLKISEERFKFALETSTSGFWDWDIKANAVYYSPQSLKILELDVVNNVDAPERWAEIVHPDDLEKYYKVIYDHFDEKTPFYENFHRVLTSKEKYKWILSRGKVIERDANGNPLKVIGTHTDVSSQKEKELELMKKMEFYSEKNNRLLNFSHIVSHNLNSHAGNFKLLLDMIDLEENFAEKRETMKYLRTVSNDLNKTIEDLSQIVNIQNNAEIAVEPLNLNAYLSRVLNIVNAYSYRNNATIINNIPAEATINFNPAYLESVLQNLCTNAIKYANPDKFLIIEFNFFLENEKKVLTIKDNGLGIDLEKYGHLLFGMYKTFHKHEKANGIGLYITKNQIESMNGRVTVESQVGKGTTFKIIFND
ncbi:PAS domain-containing sensor histidine kinase [Flavobacterium piscisymbiosum]|uniref:histidine kinase n=1 Tax=Flavobacterium piscisymbiosum TaxID=2893753 RepID=A0ABS8MGQ3_9FLAO|nr:PAS domain-containing sensor histidine kinase [Flavobacterium sp. F-30]MCC9064675.1 PAS domain-containing sensor histidine kinase [Flavobacterium sp. F-30]